MARGRAGRRARAATRTVVRYVKAGARRGAGYAARNAREQKSRLYEDAAAIAVMTGMGWAKGSALKNQNDWGWLKDDSGQSTLTPEDATALGSGIAAAMGWGGKKVLGYMHAIFTGSGSVAGYLRGYDHAVQSGS